MGTLLLRLAGPMQAWDTQSRFSVRHTDREPSKSGVIGLLCAALGKPRVEGGPDDPGPPLAALAALRMGVRVDRPGTVRVDYQTAGGTHRRGERYGVVKADGSRGETDTSRRYYLADADFLVGLESTDESLLRRLDAALAQPRWPLYLGRKAFVPGMPVRLPDQPPLGPGLTSLPLEEALERYPWPERPVRPDAPLRLVLEVEVSEFADAEVRADQPLSFAERQFALRYVRTTWLWPKNKEG